MFTRTSFHLSDFAQVGSYRVVRDCSFAFAGKIGTALAPRLVACRTERHLKEVSRTTGISGVLIPQEFSGEVPDDIGLAVAEDPVAALNRIQADLAREESGQWSGFESQIHESVRIFPGAYIAPRDVIVEEGAVIHPNAVILPRTIIGRYSSIGPGTIVGTDAFDIDISASPYRVIPQSGGVKIGAFVDIQAKCTIVRATFGGFTEIGDETKIDCQVHVAHDCEIGARVRIAACAELSGRVLVGDEAFIGPNASISNGCSIGERAHVTLGAVVTRNVDADARVTGHFAIPHQRWLNLMRKLK
jgi:UDP-3-O-[3-hydroxymyristoyl] glucosamine N-acyltransferase